MLVLPASPAQLQPHKPRHHCNPVSTAAAAPSAPIQARNSTARPQVPSRPQEQPAAWVSNELLWRQSIQHKHAQRRRRQQLQLQQLPAASLAAESLVTGHISVSAAATDVSSPHIPIKVPQEWATEVAEDVISGVSPQHTSVSLQLKQHSQPLRSKEQKQPNKEAARALTSAIGCTGDAGQLLLLLLSTQQQLDAIHVSAALNQTVRGIALDLKPPTQSYSQLQQQQQGAEVQWLLSLDDTTVQQQLQLWLQQQQQEPPSALQPQQQPPPFDTLQHPWQAVSGQVQQQLGASTDWLLVLLLCQLVQQQAATMSSQQLCTCLNSITQLLQHHADLPLLAAAPVKSAAQQLLLSAHARLHQLDPRGLSLVLHAAAGLAGSRGGFSPASGFMLAWYRASRRQLQRFNCLDLAMCGGALGRMQMFPPAEWMADFWSCSQAAFPSFPVQELLLLLLGVAGTRRHPPQAWTSAALQQLQPQLPHMSPAQLSTAMLACAKLNHVPSISWLSGFWRAWEAKQLGFTARGHATVMWGVGTISPIKPDQAQWARKLQAALQQAVASAATAVAAVALQKLRLAATQQQLIRQEQQQQQQGVQGQSQTEGEASPEANSTYAQPQLATAVLQQQQQHAATSPAQPAVPVLYNGQDGQGTQQQLEWQQQNHQQDLQQQEQQEQQQQQGSQAPLPVIAEQPELLGSASLLHPTDCAMVLYGLARLGRSCLDPNFPAFWLAQSRSQLVNMNSQELSTSLWALGKLGLKPPEVWLQQHLQCTARLAGCMSHKQLAMVLWGCARLGYLPHVGVTAELLMSAAEQLPRFSPASLCLMLWSLGALRLRPNKEWMQLVVTHAGQHLLSFDGQDFSGVLVGLHALGYHPGAAWLDKFMGVLATKIHIITPKQHERITAVLRAFGYDGSNKGFAWVLDPAAVAIMCNRPMGNAVGA